MNDLKQKFQSINLISSDYQINQILNVHLISGGTIETIENLNAIRYYRPDYFIDTINDMTSTPLTIWELKNGKNN